MFVCFYLISNTALFYFFNESMGKPIKNSSLKCFIQLFVYTGDTVRLMVNQCTIVYKKQNKITVLLVEKVALNYNRLNNVTRLLHKTSKIILCL